ncbi:transcriptional regulator GcvA [Microvirga sesbaniae]|uniref:transcriptional regulator GcvA n=1 Tax=Microvirga sesbaniae TaxID=681392 RepID=UPI0021C62510|nr:transcriptional regulator GcvA [Microvirga sp. HBU67692]
MRKLPPLATLRAFEAAARHLSFKRAANELAVTPTAISHQIRLLEETLGQKLFERRTRRVIMTSAAQTLYIPLRDSFDAIARAVERVSAIKAASTVTLTATMAFTSKWLVPRTASFRQQSPGINLRLLASDDVIDLRTGAADIAVRYGAGTYPGCRSQLLFRETFAPVCSPHLNVRTPPDLEDHALIHSEWRQLDEITPTWPRWYAKAGLPYQRSGSDIVFTDETHAIQAAVAGQGIALAGLALVADELATGTLAAPLGSRLTGRGFYLVIPDGHHDDSSVEAVREWLISEAESFVSGESAGGIAI